MFQSNKHVFLSSLVVLLLAVAVCFRFFGEMILQPNEFLFGAEGDGLKNYFSVAYQVIHGDGMWFKGMLYPYGDNIIFADGQPLLTKILSWFIEPDVNNGTQIIGIMNLLMIGSLAITAWCLHRLLVWNYVNPWFAVPFALTIAFLSPQVARFIGHYALGYAFFIPMTWLFIASFSRAKWPWLVAFITSIVVLLFGFLHPYYLFLFVIFLGAVIGWELLINKFNWKAIDQFFPKVFAVIVPLVLFMIYQKTANVYTDRPTSPAGIFSLMASFQSVFVPVADPFRNLFHNYFFRIFIPTSWEGNAYIGMVASFTAFVSVLAFGKRALKRHWKILTHPVLPPALKMAFIPGVIALLFSMGVIHNLGLYWLSDFVTPLKQFRSLGRVAWIFYYVFSVWTAYHLYALWRHFRGVRQGRYTYHISVIVALCSFLWMLDAIVNIKYNKSQMAGRSAREIFSDNYVSQWQAGGVNIQEYQAILPLPMALIGSEKIGLEIGHKSLLYAMKGSFSSGLPMIGGAMSRTSLGVTEKTAQLVADSLFPRPILDELDQEKKLLLLQSDEPLNLEEQRLIDHSTLIFKNEQYSLHAISVADIKSMYEQIRASADSLITQNNDHYLYPSSLKSNDESLWGAPTFEAKPLDHLLDSVFDTSTNYVLSYWVKVDPDKELLPNRVYSIDREWKTGGGIGSSPNLRDGWLLYSENLATESGKRHTFTIHARSGIISRVQLRKADETVVHSQADGVVFINNVPLK